MKIRDAKPADLPAIEPLFRAFEDEIPEPPWVDVDVDDELRDLAETLDQGTMRRRRERERRADRIRDRTKVGIPARPDHRPLRHPHRAETASPAA